MMKSKTRGLLALIVFSTMLAGCGADDKTAQAGSEPTAQSTLASSAEPQATPAANDKQTLEAIIYLTDDQLLETVEKKAVLEYGSDEELIDAAVAALQQDEGTEKFSLWKDIKVLSTNLEAGLVTLDISIPDEARLGAPGEQLLVDTLQKTLFQFDIVQAIEITVDGEAVETLMGHVELEHPIKRQS